MGEKPSPSPEFPAGLPRPMNPQEVIALLEKAGVPSVVIGGIALRLYGSPRVTQDLDLVIRAQDADRVVGSVLQVGYLLVLAVWEDSVEVARTLESARRWIEAESPASLTFVLPKENAPTGRTARLLHDTIRAETQVDILFDLSVPFGHLRHRATTQIVGGVELRIASPGDLIRLKEARSDPSPADRFDIDFLRRLELQKPQE